KGPLRPHKSPEHSPRPRRPLLSPQPRRPPRQDRRAPRMPATPTIIGALLGLSTQMYSNALRKLPYMRHPWEHVLGMGLGAVFVNQLVKFDDKVKEDLDKMLERAREANERRYIDDDE
uniref:Excitatory amino acid transporter n=3 Tax=Setaria TaxID=4554 RepID=K4A1B3_SETIT